MKKILFALLMISLLFVGFSAEADHAYCDGGETERDIGTATSCSNYCAYADNKYCKMPEDTACYCNPLREDALTTITDGLINFIFTLSLFVIPVLVIWGAFMIATSAEDEERRKKGRDIIFWSLVGFLIVLLSRGLSDLLEVLIGFSI